MEEQLIGEISNYFKNISVIAFEVTKGKLQVGDNIRIKGKTTDFSIKVESIQSEHDRLRTYTSHRKHLQYPRLRYQLPIALNFVLDLPQYRLQNCPLIYI